MLLRLPTDLDETKAQVEWADWLELSLLYTEPETVSRADLHEALELHYPEEGLLEATVDGAFGEIRYRLNMLGDSYPIRHEGTHVARRLNWRDCVSFSFLLALSVLKFYRQTTPRRGAWQEPARLFEYLASAGVARYMNGRAVRIGTHREPPVPYDLTECLAYLGQQMAETPGGPVNPTVDGGDENCDVVGWAPFADGRPGQLVMLAQCSIGQGWRKKLTDLRIDNVWDKQIEWHVRPIRAFAVPYLADADSEEWKYVCTGGVHFDRLRLSSLVHDDAMDGQILDEIRNWCNGFAGRLPYVD